jgi:hypothetical protein
MSLSGIPMRLRVWIPACAGMTSFCVWPTAYLNATPAKAGVQIRGG